MEKNGGEWEGGRNRAMGEAEREESRECWVVSEGDALGCRAPHRRATAGSPGIRPPRHTPLYKVYYLRTESSRWTLTLDAAIVIPVDPSRCQSHLQIPIIDITGHNSYTNMIIWGAPSAISCLL